ncbi:MAG: hypothetical protein ABEI57_00230 [Halapricum sp.]
MAVSRTRRRVLQLLAGSATVGLSGCGIPGNNPHPDKHYPFTPRPFTEVAGDLSPAAVLQSSDHPGLFGHAVATTGETVLVGAPGADTAAGANAGAVYVFRRTEGEWTQTARLTASDGREGDKFGSILAIDGDTAIVKGDSTNPIPGYVFERDDDNRWKQTGTLTDRKGAKKGYKLAVHDGIAVVAGLETETYLFERVNGTWQLQQTLRVDTDRRQIASMAADGTTIAIGLTPFGGLSNIGRVYLYERSDGSWTQTTKFDGGVGFGDSVAISGDTGVVLDSANSTAYVLRRSSGSWKQEGKYTWTNDAHPLSERSRVALDGQTVLVGSRGQDGPGAFHLLRLDTETRRGTYHPAPDDSEMFGSAVALADGTAVVSDPDNRSVYLYGV